MGQQFDSANAMQSAININEQTEENRIVKKVLNALIPLAIIGLFVSFIDRTNIGVAGPPMSAALGLTSSMFGLAAGLFFIGYVIFEIPSNLMLRRFGARIWIARIMMSWGLVCVAMAWVSGPNSLYTMRFILGVFEAGFYPGILFYFSLFIPGKHLARAYSLFQIGIPISLALGSVLTAALLLMDGILGFSGWQWVFIVEGGLAVVVSFVCLKTMANTPDDAKWLTKDEKEKLNSYLKDSKQEINDPANHGLSAVKAIFKNPRAWYYCIIYIFMMIGFYSVTYWAPQIIKLRMGLSNVDAGLVSAIPWAVATVVLIYVSSYTSRYGRKGPILVGVLAIAGIGMLISSLATNNTIALVGLCMGACIQAAVPLLYSFPAQEFSGAKSAVTLALINSVGNIGGFFGPYLLGILRDATGADVIGQLLLSSSFLIAAFLAIGLLKKNRPLQT